MASSGSAALKRPRDHTNVNYHHFALTFDKQEVAQRMQDVRFVLVAGCWRRAEAMAQHLAARVFNGTVLDKRELERLTKSASSRFTLFKVGPVLVSDHGMGPASMSIALHELLIMCQVAGVIDKITLLRFGTSGGVGVSKGTLCVTNKSFDSMLQDFVELKICLRVVRRPVVIDAQTSALLERLAREELRRLHAAEACTDDNDEARKTLEELGNLREFEVAAGATIGTCDFYEEQGRTNGAICEHTHEDKMRFLQAARDAGVINMEMESNHLSAMCHHLGVAHGIVCVALNNRLADDKVTLSEREHEQFVARLAWILSLFIVHKLRSAN